MSTQESLPTTPDAPMGDRSIEVAPQFFPTPERVSQFLEMETEKVSAELKSVEGRDRLFQALLEHEEYLRQLDPSFNPEKLRTQLDLVGESLTQKKAFLDDVNGENVSSAKEKKERKGFFGRMWERVKNFGRNHPVITTLLAIALVVGGIALVHKIASAIELAQTGLGADVVKDFLEGTDAVNRPIGPMPDFSPYRGMPKGL